MKIVNRYAMFLIAVAFVAAGIALFSAQAGAQDDGWRIMRADYGHKEMRVDVTDHLIDLLARIENNEGLEVNNQSMGGDPAPGKAKSLRIFARNRKNEERLFEFSEGHFVEGRQFLIRRQDLDDRPANYGDRDRDDYPGVRIVRAYYGVQGRTVNVTELLRSRVRDGVITFVVTNSALGGDPAAGADKVLIVVYRYQGTETATAVREGNTLSLP